MSELAGKGVFLLSIDTELAWGGVHNGAFVRRRPMLEQARGVIARLLGLLERHQVRATWAIVGHLFLDSCRPRHGLKHPEIVRPSYAWYSGDWFQHDPCTDARRDPLWYGPDIVEAVLRCRVPQEVGSHGFSHMVVGDPGCSRECFDSELKASLAAASRWGIAPRSFVFPRNSIGHLDVLAANGFTTFRGLAPGQEGRGRVSGLLANVLPLVVVARPRRVDGLWDLPATDFYLHREGYARAVPMALRVRKAVAGLRRAASQAAIFHLWFHPFNLASDAEALLGGLEAIFREAARLRGQGVLDNLTMGELAQRLDALAVERTGAT